MGLSVIGTGVTVVSLIIPKSIDYKNMKEGDVHKNVVLKKCGEDPANLTPRNDHGKDRDVWKECEKRIWDDYYYWNPKGEVTEVKNN